MSSQRRVGVILGYVNIFVKNIVNLIYIPMLLSFVGQADYGVYQSCNSFVFSLTLLSFGFSQAYVRFFTRARARGDDAEIRRLNGVYLVLYVLISLAALIIGFVSASSAGVIFSKGFSLGQIAIAESMMRIMSVSISVSLFNSVFDAYILAHEEFRFQQTRQLVTTVATPFFAYALLCLGFGVIGVAAAQMILNIVLLVLNALFCLGSLIMRFDILHFDSRLFKAVGVFSAWIFANQICNLINQNVPNVLLGALSGATAVAIYAVAVQIRTVFASLSTTISSVFTPEINRMVAESDDNLELTNLMTRVGRYQMILFCWVFGAFILLGMFFISAWAGEEFKSAYWLVVVMTAPTAISLTQNTGIEIQRAKNKHRARSLVYLIMAVINLAVTALLAPSLGYWAPVIGYVIYVGVGCGIFMNWYYSARIGLDMGLFWRNVLPVVGCGALATAVCLVGSSALPVSNWSWFFIWGAVYTLIYAISLLVLVLSRSEREDLKLRILRRFNRVS